MYRFSVAMALLLMCGSAAAAQSVQYDASGNVHPANPPFVRYDASHPLGFINGYNAPQSVSGGIYRLGPTDTSRYTFWYTDALVLDHVRGVEISARLRLVSESSANPADRAGLALSLTDDRNLYQELYINASEAFINKAGRLRDAAWSVDATQWHDYALRLIGDAITVDIDGITRLTGSVFAAANTLPNWAVVGDITSSAQSEFEMTRFSVTVLPEPAVLALAGAFVPLLRRARPRPSPRPCG